jgi:hypothetical protein
MEETSDYWHCLAYSVTVTESHEVHLESLKVNCIKWRKYIQKKEQRRHEGKSTNQLFYFPIKTTNKSYQNL